MPNSSRSLRHHANDPAVIIMDLHDRLREAHAENLELRERLVAYGDERPAPDGVITLTRIRNLENVLDLARIHCNALPSEMRESETAHALYSACMDAGRAP